MQQATHTTSRRLVRMREPTAFGLVCATALAASAVVSRHTLSALVNVWDTQPEYSYGYVIPAVFLFLLFQRLNQLSAQPVEGSWTGTVMVLAGLIFQGLGRVSTLDTVAQYGLLLTVWGLSLSYLGWRGFRAVLVPFAVLAFLVPIPNYLLREISQILQLLSSRLGVELIQWCGISVYLEGNVIDLGTMKLQVVEACSGLRYLFSLLILSFLVAYLYRDRLWKRLVIWLSAIPITVLMNSVRIALVGATVDRWGREAAEGVLHDFEGVSVFIACVAILLVEIWVFMKLSGDCRSLRDALALELPPLNRERLRRLMHLPSRSASTAVALLVVAAVLSIATPERSHAKPDRVGFATFPMQLANWQGLPARLDPEILDFLKLDDYLLAHYSGAEGLAISLFVVYYALQADGNSAHSPRACIPGDGWEIQRFDTQQLEAVKVDAKPLDVNRVVIQKGENRALVYYWFQQRGRFDTDEYMVKLHIFEDSLLRGRTDGAMVRLVTPLELGEDLSVAEARLQRFAASALPELRRHIPE
jgi:exosortase D (VPLPA-CTERM-specific)